MAHTSDPTIKPAEDEPYFYQGNKAGIMLEAPQPITAKQLEVMQRIYRLDVVRRHIQERGPPDGVVLDDPTKQ